MTFSRRSPPVNWPSSTSRSCVPGRRLTFRERLRHPTPGHRVRGTVADVLTHTGMNAAELVLEMTESIHIADNETTRMSCWNSTVSESGTPSTTSAPATHPCTTCTGSPSPR